MRATLGPAAGPAFAALAVAALAGCAAGGGGAGGGADAPGPALGPTAEVSAARSSAAVPAGAVPVPPGRAAGHRPPALGRAAARGRPVAGVRCGPAPAAAGMAHVEAFAGRRVVRVPAGIGIAPPRRRDGAYVRGGRCRYPAVTEEPTGLVRLDPARRTTLGQFFAVWGQALSARRLGAFRGRVAAWLDGRRWRRSPAAMPLRPGAVVVVETGGYVPPHRSYVFPGTP